MDKKKIAQRLRALATEDVHRSKAARLRDVMDDIEAALLAGVPRSSIIRELAGQGLDLSLATFETSLKRIRKERRIRASDTVRPGKALVKPEECPSPVVQHVDEDNPVLHRPDPVELDRIIRHQPDLAALAKLAKRKSQ